MSKKESVDISETNGDVIGGKISGLGTIGGKDVNITIQEGGSFIRIGDEAQGLLETVIKSQARLATNDSAIENAKKIQEYKKAEQDLKDIFGLLKQVEDKSGTKPEKIVAGNMDISSD